MKDDNAETIKLRWASVRIVERFKNVLYPIDLPILLHLLPNLGYVVPSKVHKGVLERGESLATKGNLELAVNQDNKTMGVQGREIAEVIEGFSELRQFWIEELASGANLQTHYTELTAEGIAASKRNPLEVFTRFWGDFHEKKKLSSIVGFDITNFGLRLVNEDSDPNVPDWFDLDLRPHITLATTHYFIRIVWRNRDMGTALTSFKGVEEMITNVIKGIEEE